MSDPKPFIVQFLGVDMATAYALCIVKYETRLFCGAALNYKEIEKEVMTRFLKDLSEMEEKVNPLSML